MSISKRIAEIRSKQSLAVLLYTLPHYPSVETWQQTITSAKKYSSVVFESGVSSLSPSPDVGSEVRRGLQHEFDAARSPQDVAKAFADCAPAAVLLHRAGEIDPEKRAELLDELSGVAAVLPSSGDRQCFEQVLNAGFELITEVSPQMSSNEIALAAELATGFVYLQSAPTTGSKTFDMRTVAALANEVRRHTDTPICCGFGIRTPEDVSRFVKEAGCDGVIIGSELLRLMRLEQDGQLADGQSVESFISTVVEAARLP